MITKELGELSQKVDHANACRQLYNDPAPSDNLSGIVIWLLASIGRKSRFNPKRTLTWVKRRRDIANSVVLAVCMCCMMVLVIHKHRDNR